MTELTIGRLDYEGVSFLFGDGTPYRITGFERGAAPWRDGDHALGLNDGTVMGRDTKTGPTHSLKLLVEGDGATRAEREASVRERVNMLAEAWDAARVRGTPGLYAKLTIGGRTMIGRPRGFLPDDSGLWDGTAEPELTFATVTDTMYGLTEVTRVQLVPEFTGGLPVPAEVPFVLGGGTGAADHMVRVSGSRGTWPTFVLHGPIKNAWVDVPGVGRIVTDVDLAYDQTLTVSTAHWARWTLVDGKPVNGVLAGNSARLSGMLLAPGAYQIIFGGYDPTGTSWLDVHIDPAFSSL